jgi:hypothetical protein
VYIGQKKPNAAKVIKVIIQAIKPIFIAPIKPLRGIAFVAADRATIVAASGPKVFIMNVVNVKSFSPLLFDYEIVLYNY